MQDIDTSTVVWSSVLLQYIGLYFGHWSSGVEFGHWSLSVKNQVG